MEEKKLWRVTVIESHGSIFQFLELSQFSGPELATYSYLLSSGRSQCHQWHVCKVVIPPILLQQDL